MIAISCPVCGREDSIHYDVHQEPDGDEHGVWISTGATQTTMDCRCSLTPEQIEACNEEAHELAQDYARDPGFDYDPYTDHPWPH